LSWFPIFTWFNTKYWPRWWYVSINKYFKLKIKISKVKYLILINEISLYLKIISIFEKNGAKVVIDTMSLPYIDGATLNYKDDLMGSTFEIIDNPNATESCGCGGSFSV